MSAEPLEDAPDTYPDLCERCDGTGDGTGWDEWVCTGCGGTGIAS